MKSKHTHCHLIFIGALALGIGGCSFSTVKHRMFTRSDKIIITFYDSSTMNRANLTRLLTFETENPFEIKEFRKFLSRRTSNAHHCAGSGSIVLQQNRIPVHIIQFNLPDQCATVYVQGEDVPRSRRLTRRAIDYLTRRQMLLETRSEKP